MSEPATPAIPLEKLTRILNVPARWSLLRELAKGEPLPVQELARRVGCSEDMGSKHMAILRDAGMVATGFGRLYQLAPAWRPAPGVRTLDLGHFLLKLDPPPA